MDELLIPHRCCLRLSAPRPHPSFAILAVCCCLVLLPCPAAVSEMQTTGQDPLVVLAAAFSKVAPMLILYSTYCANYDASMAELERLRHDVHGLAGWLNTQSQLPEARGLGLEAFLIKPIQRLTKYHLFFEQLLGAAPAGSVRRSVAASATLVKSVAARVNVKAHDTSVRAQRVIHDLGEVWLQLLAPHTQLLTEFNCTVVNPVADTAAAPPGKPAHAYLFNDFILLCARPSGVDGINDRSAYLLASIDTVSIVGVEAVQAAAEEEVPTKAAEEEEAAETMTAAQRWKKVRLAQAMSSALVATSTTVGLVMKVAQAGNVEEADTFELTFGDPRAHTEACNSIMRAKKAELERRQRNAASKVAASGAGEYSGADGRPKLVRQDSDRTLRRYQVMRILAAALREDRLAASHGQATAAGANLKRACRELAREDERAGAQPHHADLKSVSRELHLGRFMGRWHVVAVLGDEDAGSRNAIEEYEWDGAAGEMRIQLAYEETQGGRARTNRRAAWIENIATCADWRVKGSTTNVYPLRILDCAEDYSLFMAGDPGRSFLKIYARKPPTVLGERVRGMDEMLTIARDAGYDVGALEYVVHDEGGSHGLLERATSLSQTRQKSMFTRSKSSLKASAPSALQRKATAA